MMAPAHPRTLQPVAPLLLLLLSAPGCRCTRPPRHSIAHRCCADTHLRFGFMPMNVPPYFEYHEPAGDIPYWDGYMINIIDELSKEMSFSYEVVSDMYEPFGHYFFAGIAGNVSDVGMVGLSGMDVYNPDLIDHFSFTQPVFVSGTRGLGLKTKTEIGLWRLFEPFTPGLWAVVASAVCLVALTMTLLVALRHGSMRGFVSADSIAQAHYHAWAAMLGGEDYEWFGWSERILRLGFLFMILIVLSTYTANLAAFFTKPVYKFHGPKDMATMKSMVACVTWSGDIPFIKQFAADAIAPNDTEIPVHADKKKWCHRALEDGRAQVWLDDHAALNDYLLRHCSELDFAPSISLKPMVVGFAMGSWNNQLVTQMSAAMVHIMKQPAMKNLEQEVFGWGRACPPVEASDTAAVSFESLAGCFVISGVLAGLSVLMTVGRFIMEMRKSKASLSHMSSMPTDPTATEGEMIRALLGKVQEMEKKHGDAPEQEAIFPLSGNLSPRQHKEKQAAYKVEDNQAYSFIDIKTEDGDANQ